MDPEEKDNEVRACGVCLHPCVCSFHTKRDWWGWLCNPDGWYGEMRVWTRWTILAGKTCCYITNSTKGRKVSTLCPRSKRTLLRTLRSAETFIHSAVWIIRLLNSHSHTCIGIWHLKTATMLPGLALICTLWHCSGVNIGLSFPSSRTAR